MNVACETRKGCQRHLDLDVTESRHPSTLNLDRKGKSVIAQYSDFIAVTGLIRIAWKSAESREQCRNEQDARGRWRDVENYRDSMKSGNPLPNPVFLSPSLTGLTTYEMVDGARRIMAAAEAGIAELACTILRPR